MASMWRRTMLYLGLGNDEEYDDEYGPGEDGAGRTWSQPAAAPSRYPAAAPDAEASRDHDFSSGAVRTLGPQTPRLQAPDGGPTGPEPMARPQAAVVRPLQPVPSAKPQVVEPTSFNEAQAVADLFKGGSPVIVNLQNVDRDLSRRMIDFASGLCYGLGGQMERVANHVYLLTPVNVEVSTEERRRLEERGYER